MDAPKKLLTKITLDLQLGGPGQSFICEPSAVAEFIGNDIKDGEFDPGDQYTVEFVGMTQEELDALGDWGGW